MHVPLEAATTSRPRAGLPARETHALRVLLDAELDLTPAASRHDVVRQVCDAARAAGLSITELIVEIKHAWADLPAARRTASPRGTAALERVVSCTIEEFYRR